MPVLRSLQASEVEFTIECLDEDQAVRGNALDSGDPDYDRQVEDELIARLDSGDTWAWCTVRVSAHWNGFRGEDYLGACSYADESDFISGGYYEQMKEEALSELNRLIAGQYARLAPLVTADVPASV